MVELLRYAVPILICDVVCMGSPIIKKNFQQTSTYMKNLEREPWYIDQKITETSWRSARH